MGLEVDRHARGGRRRTTRWIVSAIAVFAASLFAGASPVSAHTQFDSSNPTDQSTVDEPVDVVTISFTGPATPVGEGFVALDAEGVVRTPTSVDTADGQTFSIRFEPALAGGTIGVRWNVQAADSHPIDGSFSFTVTAPVPTTAAPATTNPPSTTAEPTTTAAPTTGPAGSVVSTTEAAAAPASSTSAAPTSSTIAPVVTSVPGAGTGSVQSLDEFLDVDGAQPGESTALVGRILEFLGVTVSLGAIVFALTTLRGTRIEVRWLLGGAALLAALIATGAIVEYIGVAAIADEPLGSTWSTSAGYATLLRFGGGLVLVAGLLGTIRRNEIGSTARALSAAIVDDIDRTQSMAVPAPVRWRPTERAWPIALGATLVLASFWFDGHTVTEGVRPLHAFVDTVHVAAGSIWVGGVVSLCAIAWRRHRADHPTDAAELAVRFSSVATVALAVVAVAGALMAVFVLDSFRDLTGTEWGQTLLVKLGAVAVAVALGAYNHFRLVPALDEPGDGTLANRLRNTLTVEAAVLGVVVLASAWLVAAAT